VGSGLREGIQVKEALGHGRFLRWIEAEFGMSERAARNFMGVATTFKSATVADLRSCYSGKLGARRAIMMPKINPASLAVVLGAVVTPCFAQTLEEKLRGCDSCHGEQGVPKDKSTPVIWGQQQGHIDAVLTYIKRGVRATNEQMAASVRDLDRFDIVAISAHYAQKQWPDLQQPPAPSEIAQRAEQLISKGQCTEAGCHVGLVGDSGRPRVAGQFSDYLKTALTAYRDKTRKHVFMERAVEGMTDADIQALATYLAGLKQP
jgi:cytochrome c553